MTDDLTRTSHMLAQQCASGDGVAGLQAQKDQAVLLDRFLPSPELPQCRKPRALHTGHEPLVRRDKHTVLAGLHDRPVNALVGGEVGIEIAAPVRPQQRRLHSSQCLELDRGDPLRGQFGRRPLDAGGRLEQLLNLDRVDGRHARRAIAPEFHKPFGGQQLHGFAKRSPRHPEAGAKLRLGDVDARWKRPAHDHAAQLVGSLGMQGAARAAPNG